MTEQPQQTSEPTPADLARLAERRAFIENYLADDALRESCGTTTGKLSILRTLLEAQAFGPAQTWELQSMGVVLGDAFVQELGLRWIMVEDEYGRDPALSVPGKSVLLFPLTMISKRVEAGRAVDVLELFNWTVGEVHQL